jgi:hypothetical protein
MEIERTQPGTLQWWADMENFASDICSKQSAATFRSGYGYDQLINAARNQGDLFKGFFDEDPDMDAECGLWCGEAA